MRRLPAIAALLLIVLMLPLSSACAASLLSTKGQHGCCAHSAAAGTCSQMSANPCCTVQAPLDPSPAMSEALAQLPMTAVIADPAHHRADVLQASTRAQQASPAQHSPPGLLIASTIVLRI